MHVVIRWRIISLVPTVSLLVAVDSAIARLRGIRVLRSDLDGVD